MRAVILVIALLGAAGAWYILQTHKPPVTGDGPAAIVAPAVDAPPQPQPAEPAQAPAPEEAKPEKAPETDALPANAQKAVDDFLSSHQKDGESAQAQGSTLADLDADGKGDIVLVWTLLGPTYWHNSLTVFTEGETGYAPTAALQLGGEAKLSGVKDGLIVVDEVNYAEGDPVCCPTLKGTWSYKWQGSEISRTE